MELRWKDIAKGKQKNSEKILSQCDFDHRHGISGWKVLVVFVSMG
jgi:hypothetical protein